MNEESLRELSTKLSEIHHAVDRIATVGSNLTQQDHLTVSDLTSDLERHRTSAIEIQRHGIS
jgi:hypothetical protein